MKKTTMQYVAFAGHRRIADGSLPDVARAVRETLDSDGSLSVAVFETLTSAPVDLDLRGTPDEVAAKAEMIQEYYARAIRGDRPPREAGPAKPGPGRPKLGVVGREVTLLPRHWDWLASQPGGASVTLRKLVEKARKEDRATGEVRQTQDVAHRFMYAMAGDLPGFEEAARALYAWDLERVRELIAGWPPDLRTHVLDILERTG